MDNKYLYMLVASIIGVGSYMVGTGAYYGIEGNISNMWIMATILAVVLGAGNNSGTDVVSIFKDGVMGAIPMLITMAIYIILASVIYQLATADMAIDPKAIVHTLATFVAAGLFANLIYGYLKKAM